VFLIQRNKMIIIIFDKKHPSHGLGTGIVTIYITGVCHLHKHKYLTYARSLYVRKQSLKMSVE
jgi:hypothetical protein